MPTKRYDVFISYAREDEAFRKAVERLLEGWKLSVFVDKNEIPGGAGWRNEIEGLLSRNSGAVVIVLGTPTLNNKLREAERLGKLDKNFVRIEVTRALEQNLIVILLRFVKDIDQLLGTGHLQYIDGDTTRTEFEAVAAPEFTRRLRSALHEKLRRDFVDARQQIVAWIEKIREPVKQSDFGGQHWRELFEFKNEDGVSSEEVDVALVASGGSGKTGPSWNRVGENDGF